MDVKKSKACEVPKLEWNGPEDGPEEPDRLEPKESVSNGAEKELKATSEVSEL